MLAAAKSPGSQITIQFIALEQIQRNSDLQMREHLDEKHVEILAGVIGEGGEPEGRLPVVFFDGQRNWLADGYHRHAAHERSGIKKMKCEIILGSFEDAKLFAASANARHGKSLDQFGIKKAVLTLRAHPFAKWWTAGQIANHVGCHQTYVSKFTDSHSRLFLSEKDIPDQLSVEAKDKIRRIIQANGTPRIFTNKHGSWSVVDVAPVSERASRTRKTEDKPAETDDRRDACAPREIDRRADCPTPPVQVSWPIPAGYVPDEYDQKALALSPDQIIAATIGVGNDDLLALRKLFSDDRLAPAIDENKSIADQVAQLLKIQPAQVLDYRQFHDTTDEDWGGADYPALRESYAQLLREQAACQEETESQELVLHAETARTSGIYRDARGRICERAEIIEAFKAVPIIQEKLKKIDDLLAEIAEVATQPGGLALRMDSIAEAFKTIKTALRDGRPFVICPVENESHKKLDPHSYQTPCGYCNNTRWLTYRKYQTLPENAKKLVEDWGNFYRAKL